MAIIQANQFQELGYMKDRKWIPLTENKKGPFFQHCSLFNQHDKILVYIQMMIFSNLLILLV